MANESALRQRVGQLLRESGFFVQAVESTTNPGMFDTYYRKNKQVVGWIEFKLVKHWPARPTTSLFKSLNHPLSNEQAVWAYRELTHGGRADIVVGYERSYFFIPGTIADVFNDLTAAEIEYYHVRKERIVEILEETDYYARDL